MSADAVPISAPINCMPIAEFRELGFLQEVNRRFFHPRGLALSVTLNPDGTSSLADVWDYRDDPEGITFGPDMIDPIKVATVEAELAKHAPHRAKLFGGTIVQPVTG